MNAAHLRIALHDEAAFRREVTTPEEVLGLRMRALCMIAPHLVLPDHRDFIYWVCKKPTDHLTAKQREHVTRTAWRYRRHIPAHLAPKVNPDDPIVRALVAKGELHV